MGLNSQNKMLLSKERQRLCMRMKRRKIDLMCFIMLPSCVVYALLNNSSVCGRFYLPQLELRGHNIIN